MSDNEVNHAKELVGALLGIAAVVGFVFSLLVIGGPNARYISTYPTGWWGVLPYGVMLLGTAAYLLIRDTL